MAVGHRRLASVLIAVKSDWPLSVSAAVAQKLGSKAVGAADLLADKRLQALDTFRARPAMCYFDSHRLETVLAKVGPHWSCEAL